MATSLQYTVLLLAGLGTSLLGWAEMPIGDAERGRLAFAKCRTCHYPEKIVGHNNGPSLHAIFGQVAGKQSGFQYSPLLAQAEFVWTPELLYSWLGNSEGRWPGTQMVFAPLPSDQERADIVAYLQLFNEN